ncbi:MAG: helix-turn-helix transcriptional regulator [Clostridia bacterium]|nr:helix-turn-helix transcriptional regulator [Clostridia bacterium]
MQIVSLIVEPLVSWTYGQGNVVAEAYLRLTCASIYRLCGNFEEAARHIDRAVAITLPDRLYGLLAEYGRTLGALLEEGIVAVDPAAWEEIKVMAKVCSGGWSRLSGAVRGKNIVTTLTDKQREVAKLASFGMSNKEIATKLDMSLAGVKQALLAVSDKLGGVSRDHFAAYL